MAGTEPNFAVATAESFFLTLLSCNCRSCCTNVCNLSDRACWRESNSIALPCHSGSLLIETHVVVLGTGVFFQVAVSLMRSSIIAASAVKGLPLPIPLTPGLANPLVVAVAVAVALLRLRERDLRVDRFVAPTLVLALLPELAILLSRLDTRVTATSTVRYTFPFPQIMQRTRVLSCETQQSRHSILKVSSCTKDGCKENLGRNGRRHT